MAHDYCPECNGELLVTTDRLSNGDEVTLLYCERNGIYSIYSPETDTVTTKDDHNCGAELETYHHKRDNGDRLTFYYCADCGFYAADDTLAE